MPNSRAIFFATTVVMLGLWKGFSAVQELPGSGNDYSLPDGAVSTRSKTIANNFYEGTGGGGTTVKNVNLFNLTTAYSLPLGGVALRGQIAHSISLNYSGNVWSSLVSDNEKAASLPVALGWSIGNPFVAVNHRGTTTYTDDVVFCDLGSFGGGQLLQHHSTGVYFLSNNPTVKIENVVNAGGGELDGQIESWIFTMPNGQKLFFGDASDGIVSNSERVILQNGNQTVTGPFRLDAAKPFIYRWDILAQTDAPAQGASMGSNRIVFEYEKTNVAPSTAYPGKVFTAESHVKEIKTLDRNGDELESQNFFYSQAASRFYIGYESGEPLFHQKIFISKSLDKIEGMKGGSVYSRHTLKYIEIPEGPGENESSSGAKRLLDSVSVQLEHNGRFVDHGSYAFKYMKDDSYSVGNMESITTPEGGKKSFQIGDNIMDDLSPPTHTMKDPDNTGNILRLPGAISELEGRYRISTNCSERFCYVTVASTRKEDNGLTYLEIYHNTGRYWESEPVFRKKITSTWPYPNVFADEISVIPMGDRFFIAHRYATNVAIYDWNGESFSLSQNLYAFDGMFTASESRKDEIGISLFPGPNFVVIHHRSASFNLDNTSRIHVYLKNPSTGVWENLASNANCQVNNSNNHGEEVRSPSRLNFCFEFANTSSVGSKLIQISVSGSMFTVVDGSKGIVFAFLLNKSGNGFTDISSSFLPYNTPDVVHMAGHPNNLNHFVKEPIYLGDDFFILKTQSETGNAGSSRIHVFHYNGVNVQRIASDVLETDHLVSGSIFHNRRIWMGGDYFLTSNMRNDIIGGRYFKFWKKTGDGSSFTFTPISLPLPGFADGIEFLVATHPKSFYVAYYRNGDQNLNPGFPSDPPVTYSTGSGTDYRTYLFRIDGNRNPVLLDDADQPRDDRGRKYVSIWYSSANNTILAKSTWNGNSACTPGITCTISMETWRFFPYSSLPSPFASYLYMLPPYLAGGETFYLSQYVQSAFPSLFSRAALIQQASNQSYVKIQLLFSGPIGIGSGYSPRVLSVSDFVNPAGTEKITTTFQVVDNDRKSYNYATGNVDHESIRVKTGVGNGYVDYLFYLDDPLNPLKGRRKELSGQLRSTRVHKETGLSTLLSTQTTDYFDPYHNASWPTHLFVNRIDMVNQSSFSGNDAAGLLNRTKFLNYNDGNGMPQFTSQFLRAGSWRMSQTLFNNLNLPTQSVVYEVSDTVSAHAEARNYVPNGLPFRNLGGVASSKTEYSTLLPRMPVRSFIWRDPGTCPVHADQPLNDLELKAGTVPVFKLNRGFEMTSEITRVNAFNQVVEVKSRHSNTKSDFASTIYEGRGDRPVATFTSCRSDNCAILLAENGIVASTGLDLPTSTVDLPARNNVSRWRSSGAAFNSSRSHTGKYSLKVVNDSGPIIDLHLKDVAEEGIDYVISAWVYAEPGSTPVLRLSRRQANGTSGGIEIDGFNGSPKDGSLVFKKWQRWEVTVSNTQLLSGGLFGGNDDFIRVFAGTPNGGGTVYLDDIICKPVHSGLVFRTYNEKGQVDSETNSDHLTRYFEIGHLGNVTAVRDENYRILGQAGANRLGEDK